MAVAEPGCFHKVQVCFIYIAHLKTTSTADQSAEQTKTLNTVQPRDSYHKLT